MIPPSKEIAAKNNPDETVIPVVNITSVGPKWFDLLMAPELEMIVEGIVTALLPFVFRFVFDLTRCFVDFPPMQTLINDRVFYLTMLVVITRCCYTMFKLLGIVPTISNTMRFSLIAGISSSIVSFLVIENADLFGLSFKGLTSSHHHIITSTHHLIIRTQIVFNFMTD